MTIDPSRSSTHECLSLSWRLSVLLAAGGVIVNPFILAESFRGFVGGPNWGMGWFMSLSVPILVLVCYRPWSHPK